MRNTRRSGFSLALVFTMAFVVLPTTSHAQDRGSRTQDREEMEQRFRRQMGRMIQERLGLDDAQSEALSDVVRGFDGRRRELGRAEMAARRRVEALLLEGGQDDAEAQELLTRMIELRAEEAQLFALEQEALLEVLSPVQVLQLQSLREDLGRRIRSLRGREGPPSRRRGGNEDPRGRFGPDVSPDQATLDVFRPG